MFDREGHRKYLNATERRAFRRAVATEPDMARRAFCLTLFYSGCRISEALELTAERVDLTSKLLVFETLKQRQRGRFRAVLIPDKLVAIFKPMLADASPSERV